MRRVILITMAVGLLVVPSASASYFQAGDLIFVPAVAHNDGSEGSVWRSDLTITNVDSVPVDVAIFFLPSGVGDNSAYVLTRTYGLSGREDEGWGHVNEALADIPSGGTVSIEDIVGQYWSPSLGVSAYLGGLAIFAYEAGTADAEDGPTYRNIIATARTYNLTTIWTPDPDSEDPDNPTFIEEEATYGQTIPGVPWYAMADPSAVSDDKDFSYLVLPGGADNDILRYNIGFMNTSDSQTGITLRVTAYDSTGAQYVDGDGNPIEKYITLGPLSQFQINRAFLNWFEIEDVSDALIKVEFDSWQTNSPTPTPFFTVYGSLVDGRTNDPTTILPSFGFPFDVDCLFKSDGGSGGGSTTSLRGRIEKEGLHRPLSLPTR